MELNNLQISETQTEIVHYGVIVENDALYKIVNIKYHKYALLICGCRNVRELR